MAFISEPEKDGSSSRSTAVSNESTDVILVDILRELKKMNLHLSMMNDINIQSRDVEV